ncbi:DUF4426 domain-containing protein [Wenzhouxiangella sp. XN24]|uniref:DUF4426 domain-containing protein n=1 Tax=Wenzhouxiangella sp. XN24 TaxID=2713569 RepID=UPI0013EAD94C|nr:DUF4426 domain-containing protein [Wenzhouxiangella sp. XN24]NGX16085.1 DUF4426 domain-containing protein [Wenzhouxiangella sp. XN24]
MSRTRALFAVAVACLAALATACGRDASRDSQGAPPAREITRPSSETFGDYIVHFNAQSTTMLPAQVARAFGIQRGENRAMLNIAVLRRDAGSEEMAVEADVNVAASNLLGQVKNVRLRELREGEAIYYIGEITVANEEIVKFDISVQPEGLERPYEFSFKQQFYTN